MAAWWAAKLNWRLALTGALSVVGIGLLGWAVTGGSAAPAPSAPVVATSTPTAVATASPTVAPSTTAAPATTTAAKPAAKPAAARVVPTMVHIPALNVESTLIPLGLNPDKTVQVPPVSDPLQGGWYTHDAVPGDVGAAVLLAHTDGDGRNGLFHDIKSLNLGDQIVVDRSDGKTVTFSVYKVRTVPKDQFPSASVYGPTKDAELRLVTCGGPFNPAAKSYESSVIVYARLVS